MVKTVDLIIQSAAQLVTCASPNGAKRGKSLADIGLIEDGAVAIHNGFIVGVGKTTDICRIYRSEQVIDASKKVVCPGLVDCHTHLVYAGSRANEFEMRIQGKSYVEIMQSGGGIISTMRATRATSEVDLWSLAKQRLDDMFRLGTTTVEIKTGYGLDIVSEIKMLRVIEQLAKTHPMTLVPTFLGAHALPPEYRNRPEDYIDLVIEEMLPAVARWYQQSLFTQEEIPFFIDVFCEVGAFDVEQSRRILEAGKRHGMNLKAHVDEFNALGGMPMAIALGAVSVDHLDVTSDKEFAGLASSRTIAVFMPTVNFNLGSTHFANARVMIDVGCAIALATDFNPGSSPCASLPMTMAIACRYQKLLPSEALNACTINAAHAIRMGDKLGSLEIGKWADIILLNTDDYRELAYQFGGNLVDNVIKRGQTITR